MICKNCGHNIKNHAFNKKEGYYCIEYPKGDPYYGSCGCRNPESKEVDKG